MDQIYSVSEISHKIKSHLEYKIPEFYLGGEISEIKYHSSGHIYFTLKDNSAIMPSVMWRSQALTLKNRPEPGSKVVCRGKLSVYLPQGRYQFIASTMTISGQGDLFLQFEKLKLQLESEGLFNLDKKKVIPDFPRHIGIITSQSGAALQDILKVFSQIAPHLNLTLAPARVQGKGSADEIITRLDEFLSSSSLPDCIIIARGGGSIEDLWEFNNESLARYISSYKLPVLSGVGHETDFSICDFVSDYRASTPTAAAETCVQNWKDSRNQLEYLDSRFLQALES
ncbi:exodeoxyribonuclease VII large subunit, partial [bacterium]|nr:exodeoxyribonuclease VII large subunit [bacterium]